MMDVFVIIHWWLRLFATRKMDDFAFYAENRLHLNFININENECDEMYFYYIIIALLSPLIRSKSHSFNCNRQELFH